MYAPSGLLLRLALLALFTATAAGVALAQPPPPVWHSPSLAWAGLNGYASDGVEPGVSRPGVLYAFKVKYLHPDRTPPLSVKVGIRNSAGAPIPGSPFTMTSDGTTTWTTGVIYTHAMKLNQRGLFSYRFTADDGLTTASLPASGFKSGPVVDAVPTLKFLGTTGYTTDAVEPNSGPPGTRFVFRVNYSHANGAAPTSIVLRLWGPDGKVYSGSPFALTATAGTPNYVTGWVYSRSIVLSTVGVYSYQFVVSDGLRTTTFPAARKSGPTVAAAP